MAVQPTSQPTFTSTVWNSAGKSTPSVNAAKFGGPNAKIKVGSKVQFGEGEVIYDVARIFGDGTLYLVAMSNGRRITRQVEPTDSSWGNLWMIDGRMLRRSLDAEKPTPPRVRGGGPQSNLFPGTVVLLGGSDIRWSVQEVKRDKSLVLTALIGEGIKTITVGPLSRLWNSIYPSGT